MGFPREFAEDLKNQADIVRIVSDYLTLKKRGVNYVGRCPFHSEKTPSFNVHPGKGIYKCFGCGAGGNVIEFIVQIEGCSFPEAVRIVAEKSGIPLPTFSDTETQRRSAQDREVVLKLNAWAAEFFEYQLVNEPGGQHARDYVLSRGITDETRQLFRLGYAPDRWDYLIGHLKERGATAEEIGISGLVTVKDEGGYYDKFRGRVMFPITDSQNRVIAFGGRVMGDGEPKYLNSPETAVYTKGHHLFGLALSKSEIRRLGFAILVEGYLDCILPYQEGIRNVVASLGTALTDSQVRLLRRYMEQPQIIVNFDPDSAGQAATLRSIELLLAEGFKANILRTPGDQDPDEFVRSKGAHSFRELLKATQPYMEYVIDIALGKHDLSRPSGKVAAVNEVLPHLVRMRDKVERADYAAQLADRFKVDSRIIREEIKRAATNRHGALDQKRLRAAQEITAGERDLLQLMLASSEVRDAVIPNLREDDFADLPTASLFAAIIDIQQQGLDPTYERVRERIQDSEWTLLTALLMGELACGDDFETLFKKASEAVNSIRFRRLEKQLDRIQMELSQAERESDIDRYHRLFTEKVAIGRRMQELRPPPGP